MANRIYSVAEVNTYVSRSLQMDPMLQNLSIRGELSNARRYASGHWYFTLKDDQSALRCVWFQGHQGTSDVMPREGLRVIAQGNLGLYLRDGQYQLNVTSLRPDGVGSFFERFEQLKARFQQMGYFDEERKKALPPYPGRIGIVTSPDGAALRDIIRVARRRMPWVDLVLYPVLVQGEYAADQIAEGILELNRLHACDVMIIGRGGGSIEDLWAFNESVVVEAVAASDIPVISAVGHQTDFTLSDFAADLRAATPSMAAELATCDREELTARLDQLRNRLIREGHYVTIGRREKLMQLQQRLDQFSPMQAMAARRERLTHLTADLVRAIRQAVRQRGERLERLETLLKAVSPQTITARGYALVRDQQGRLVTDASAVAVGDELTVAFTRGVLGVKVIESIQKESV